MWQSVAKCSKNQQNTRHHPGHHRTSQYTRRHHPPRTPQDITIHHRTPPRSPQDTIQDATMPRGQKAMPPCHAARRPPSQKTSMPGGNEATEPRSQEATATQSSPHGHDVNRPRGHRARQAARKHNGLVPDENREQRTENHAPESASLEKQNCGRALRSENRVFIRERAWREPRTENRVWQGQVRTEHREPRTKLRTENRAENREPRTWLRAPLDQAAVSCLGL